MSLEGMDLLDVWSTVFYRHTLDPLRDAIGLADRLGKPLDRPVTLMVTVGPDAYCHIAIDDRKKEPADARG